MARVFEGTCRLCGERYTGTGISSHVKRCLSDHADIAAIHHGLLVGARADGPGGRFWMYLLVRPESSLAALDDYLRETWFRDDETPSAFEIDGTQYLRPLPPELEEDESEDDRPPIESMETDLGGVLRPRMEFSYAFDPRNPTDVELTVFDPYPCPETLVDGDETGAATLVARDDIDQVSCDACGDPATRLRVDSPNSVESNDSDGAAESDEPEESEGAEGSEAAEGSDAPEESDESPEPIRYLCDECAGSVDDPTVPFENTPRAGVEASREDGDG